MCRADIGFVSLLGQVSPFGEFLIYLVSLRVKRARLRKFEAVYREILLASMRGQGTVQQKLVAEATGVSTGMTNKAVRKLEQASCVETGPRGLRVLSPGRILNLWATERRLQGDVWRSFRIDDLASVERDLPPEVILTAFSGWAAQAKRRPAEYDRVHFYVTDKPHFESWMKFRRDRIRKTNPNVFALEGHDPHLARTSSRGVACVPQIYVDVYAADGPEAQPFLKDIVESFPSLGLW